jgi:hypothetical protein
VGANFTWTNLTGNLLVATHPISELMIDVFVYFRLKLIVSENARTQTVQEQRKGLTCPSNHCIWRILINTPTTTFASAFEGMRDLGDLLEVDQRNHLCTSDGTFSRKKEQLSAVMCFLTRINAFYQNIKKPPLQLRKKLERKKAHS